MSQVTFTVSRTDLDELDAQIVNRLVRRGNLQNERTGHVLANGYDGRGEEAAGAELRQPVEAAIRPGQPRGRPSCARASPSCSPLTAGPTNGLTAGIHRSA
jgi:hypothetical protein